MDIRAVFFDAGETLLHPYPSFPELFADVLRERGIETDPDAVARGMSGFSERFHDTIRSDEHHLWSTSPDRSRAFWFAIYRDFLHELGIEGRDEELPEALYTRFTDLASYRLHPDAAPAIERLHEAGVTLGLISNFEEWLERLLDALDVARYFAVRVISGIEGVEKPDPKIFHLALERTGATPETSAYVGDSPFFDVEAAKEVGMVPVLIDRRDRYPDADAIRVTSLEQIPERLGIG